MFVVFYIVNLYILCIFDFFYTLLALWHTHGSMECIYTHIYVYVCLYIYICMHVCTFLCAYMYMCVYVFKYAQGFWHNKQVPLAHTQRYFIHEHNTKFTKYNNDSPVNSYTWPETSTVF
jgi:nuclear pore complex protein Nup62